MPEFKKNNEQTYQSTVIWLRIINRQVAHLQTITVTKVGKVFYSGQHRHTHEQGH